MLIRADARALPLVDGCVQCVVTSPPYWGLRSYPHERQIGLEPTPEAYVVSMIQVFTEVWRVLKDDGTVWLNLGDTFNSSPSNQHGSGVGAPYKHQIGRQQRAVFGLKPKDLVGIPWRVAFALQAAGWYLRSDIIWSKPNPMPESVTDRPTKAHEMIFLLTKSERYFYDAAAIAERVSEPGIVTGTDGYGQGATLLDDFGFQSARSPFAAVCIRLAAAVLDIAERQNNLGLFAFDSEIGHQGSDSSASLPVIHIPVVRRAASEAARFADGDIPAKEFLQQMDSLCVALPDGDDLKEAWRLALLDIGHVHADGDATVTINNASKVGQIERIHSSNYSSARVPSSRARQRFSQRRATGMSVKPTGNEGRPKNEQDFRGDTRNKRSVWHVATQPYSGSHFATFPEALIEPCILAGSRSGDLVLDPFIGSGTTGAVCDRLMRRWVGTDLSYHDLSKKRTAQRGLRFTQEQSA